MTTAPRGARSGPESSDNKQSRLAIGSRISVNKAPQKLRLPDLREECTMSAASVLRPIACCLGILVYGSLLPAADIDTKKDDAETKKAAEKIKEIAGAAEFRRAVPKHFATLKAVDPARQRVTLLIDGESLPKVWPLTPDAEIKVAGWW